MKKKERYHHSINHRHFPRTIETLTKDDFRASFNNNSVDGPITGLGLICTFDMTEIEVEAWANLSEENRKVVEIYKQKCQADLLLFAVRGENKIAGEYYKEEYGHEMSLAEKLEEAEGFSDVENPEEKDKK